MIERSADGVRQNGWWRYLKGWLVFVKMVGGDG